MSLPVADSLRKSLALFRCEGEEECAVDLKELIQKVDDLEGQLALSLQTVMNVNSESNLKETSAFERRISRLEGAIQRIERAHSLIVGALKIAGICLLAYCSWQLCTYSSHSENMGSRFFSFFNR